VKQPGWLAALLAGWLWFGAVATGSLLVGVAPLWAAPTSTPLTRKAPATGPLQEAVLAGGCFWCLEHDLETLPGVVEAVSGYSGGHRDYPTYGQVSSEQTGHQEAVLVRFDPKRISYPTLLRSYWRNVDPLDGGGQFCDRGDSYRPVIFTSSKVQQAQAEASLKAAAAELHRPTSVIRVQIKPLQRFWPGEGYHQHYAVRNSVKYNYYRWACGRDRRLDAIWGKRARSAAAWSGSSPNSPAANPRKS
jgi:peptide-methionine (S)-S-oxide reductase